MNFWMTHVPMILLRSRSWTPSVGVVLINEPKLSPFHSTRDSGVVVHHHSETSATTAPDDERLLGGRGAQRGEAVDGGRRIGTTGARGPAERLPGRLQLGKQLLVAGPEGGDLVLELEDAAYALDADPGGGELGDRAQQLDVAQGVAPAAAARTAGLTSPSRS